MISLLLQPGSLVFVVACCFCFCLGWNSITNNTARGVVVVQGFSTIPPTTPLFSYRCSLCHRQPQHHLRSLFLASQPQQQAQQQADSDDGTRGALSEEIRQELQSLEETLSRENSNRPTPTMDRRDRTTHTTTTTTTSSTSSEEPSAARNPTRKGRRRQRPGRSSSLEEEEEEPSTDRERRRRRRQQQQQQQQNQSLFGTVPDSVTTIGTKATNIAKRKTMQAWDGLKEMTYYDDDDDNDIYLNNRRSARRQRQNSPPPPPRRSQNDSYYFQEEYDDDLPAEPKDQNDAQDNDDDDDDYYESFSNPRHRERTPDSGSERRKSPSPTKNEDDNNAEEPTKPLNTTPIKVILKQLDNQGITYPPNASRQQLLDLLEKNTQKDIDDNGNENGYYGSAPNDNGNGNGNGKWKGVWTKTSKVASKSVRSIPRKVSIAKDRAAKAVQDKANQLFENEQQQHEQNSKEKNIDRVPFVDAVIEDFSKVVDDDDSDDYDDHTKRRRRRRSKREPFGNDVIIEVESMSDNWRNSRRTKMPPSQRRRRPRPTTADYYSGPSSSSSSSRRPSSARRRTRQPRPSGYYDPSYSDPTASSSSSYEENNPSQLLLPPSQMAGKKRQRSQNPNEQRKIYSPYVGDESSYGDDGYRYQDSLDGVGNFMSNTMETFLWGRPDYSPGPHRKKSGQSSHQKQRRGHAHHPRRSGHWKDRMEEQFDYVMGIHPDGKHYKRWSEQEYQDEAQATGTDSVSYARGKKSKRRNNSQQQQQQPYWDKEESLLSLLFGTGESMLQKNSLLYRSNSIFQSGSLVRLSRNIFQSFGVVGGALARWASVRGSLPQPVVVVGAMSAFLSARPGRRFRSVAVALLALRVVGELLHGYMYEDADFFEDDQDDEYEEYDDADYEDDEDDEDSNTVHSESSSTRDGDGL